MKVLCVLSRYAYGRPERGENYDYVHFVSTFERMGYQVSFFDSGDRSSYEDFAELNRTLLERVVSFRPDIIFCVLMHYEVWLETLDLIRTRTPALIVNWGTDDSWKFKQASRFFAAHVDLHVTTDSGSAQVAPSFGLSNVMSSQWAASSAAFSGPCPSASCRYDVSFVGAPYGYRATWIEALRSSGISVSSFGHGTANGVVEAAKVPEIYRMSRISLNFSGAGPGRGMRQIKARTFEVPGAGGFLLTEAAPGLERYFDVDKEIATFESPDQLVTKARYFLDHPDQRDAIALAGHQRTTDDHSYEKRMSGILQRLEAFRAGRKGQAWDLSPNALEHSIEQYRRRCLGHQLRRLLTRPLSAAFGTVRGPRAARRLIYELSWRLAGQTTYCARGLPGRLFYAES